MKKRFDILIIAVLSLVAIQSCNNKKEQDGLFIVGAEKINPSVLLTIDDKISSIGISVQSTGIATEDVTVELTAKNNLLSSYNTQYEKDYELLPQECYQLSENQLTIQKGDFSSKRAMKLEIISKEKLEEGKSYLLPVSISKVSNRDLTVIEGSETLYVIINQVMITKAANLGERGWYSVDFEKKSKYDTKALTSVTYEAKIFVPLFLKHRWCNTVMGLEENFLLRFVQDDFMGQLQIAGGGHTINGSKAVPAGQWTHVACVYDGVTGTTSIYINGELDASKTTPRGTIDLTQVYGDKSFCIAYSAKDLDRCLNGQISEVRVWASARTGAELRNNICFVDPTTESLIGYWRFNNVDEKNTVVDLTGNGYDAECKNPSLISWVDVRCPD